MSFKIGDRVIITKYWTGYVGTIVRIVGGTYHIETDILVNPNFSNGIGGFHLGEFTHLTPLVKALL